MKLKLGYLILLGSLSALFFSTAFMINSYLSFTPGHWWRSASLRYFWMFIILHIIALLQGGIAQIKAIYILVAKHWKFFLFTGTFGFGVFYSCMTAASLFAPGWILASLFMLTSFFSLLVLGILGKPIPRKALMYTGVMIVGVIVLNIQRITSQQISGNHVMLGLFLGMIAVFCYALGNQIIGDATNGGLVAKHIPNINDEAMHHVVNRILAVTIGSIPFWVLGTLVVQPTAVTHTQRISTGINGLFAGVIASIVFWFARHQTKQSYEVIAIDSTLALEIPFVIFFEWFFLAVSAPTILQWLGIFLVLLGVLLYNLKK